MRTEFRDKKICQISNSISSPRTPNSELISSYVCKVMPLRIGILMDHPSPHMVALLDALSERDDCSAEVIYFGQKAPERRWGAPSGQLPYRFLRGVTLMTGGLRVNAGLFNSLKKMRVDVWLINACYDSPSTLIAAWYLGRRPTPWVYMNEPPRPRNRLISGLKSLLLQFVLRRASGVIGMGERAAEMYRALLKVNCPTTSIPYYINLEGFFRLPITGSHGDGQPLQFLTCAQMIDRKGLDVLLRACENLKNSNWQLNLVGDGPLRHTLEREFARRFSSGQVIFRGEVPYEKRHEVFAGQQVFVLPSRWDGWGMVVPEALAAGLPVVTTDHVIAGHEFISDGVNGFLVPVDNPSALADKMAYFIDHRGRIPEMAFAARRALENYQSEVGAERLVRFLSDLVRNLEPRDRNPTLKSQGSQLAWRALTRPESISDRAWMTARQLARAAIIRAGNGVRPNAKPKGHRILVYHLVLGKDRRTFEEQIKFLTDHFAVFPISKTIHVARDEDGDKKYGAALTFDDGFRILMRDCLEILEKYSIKACFFVPTGFVALNDQPILAAKFSQRTHHYNLPLEPMQPEDLQTLVKLGHEVGSHGISHISLGAMPVKRATQELERSRQRIAEWTGVEPAHFAYPYGQTTSVLGDPAEWVRQAGYSYGFTLKRGAVNGLSHPFLLPREHAEGNWSFRDLRYFLLK